MNETKGIILAAGRASRLFPITFAVNKQLLAIYDKPMIYYPLSVLMLAQIKDVLLITRKEDLQSFKALLGNGKKLGMKISYAIQKKPRGIADAFIIGKKFIGISNCVLILGDNIFYGQHFTEKLERASRKEKGATIFGCFTKEPQRFGVIEFDTNGKTLSIEEKPPNPKSDFAVTGLYFYDNQVIEFAKSLKPSSRGELEITDLNNIYIKESNLDVEILGRGFTWLDTGTFDSLLEASQLVQTIQKSQGLKIACLEEIAYKKNWIDFEQLSLQANKLKSSPYGAYLKNMLKD